jgi:beta-lactamase class A
MLYRLLIGLFSLLFIFQFSLKNALAQNSSDISLSDAIYADLALKGYLDNVSIDLFDGNPSDSVNLNSTRQWIPASTIKIFVAMYAYSLASEGQLDFQNQIQVEDKNVVPTELSSDELPPLQTGDYVTIDRLIRQMLTQSDNTAYNVLLDVLNRQKITDYIHSLGLLHSRIGSKLNLDTSQEEFEFSEPGYGFNTTTADDYAKAFILIDQDKISGSRELFGILSQQKINTMIPALLPKDVVVAHKTGELDPLYHDGGIVISSKGKYILTMFSNIGDPNILAQISKLIYTKNFDLIGEAPQDQTLAEVPQPSVDPLVLQSSPNQSVLGASTTVQTPAITAADLGIKAKDLSLSISTLNLPRVFIPADSRFHVLVSSWQSFQKTLAYGDKGKAQIDINTAKLQLAEVSDLLKRGKVSEANSRLKDIQPLLTQLATNKAASTNPDLQTSIQSLSETRFTIFSNLLKVSSKDDKAKFIKEIAQQAKDTTTNVLPLLPKAASATNLTQKPLIGDIVQANKESITIRTSVGQSLTIPIQDLSIKVRTKDTKSQVTSLSNIPPGTTIALVGSYTGNTYVPSFALTNLNKELVAPQPATIVKINSKNNTMVVSENGVPIQVDLNKNTVIKGGDTDVGLKSLKPGDLVAVHGDPLGQKTQNVAPSSLGTPTQSGGQNTPGPALSPLTTAAPSPSGTLSSPKGSFAPTQQPASLPNNAKPLVVPATTAPSTQGKAPAQAPAPAAPKSVNNPPPPTQTHVIEGKTIQVIQRAEHRSAPPPAQHSQPATTTHKK